MYPDDSSKRQGVINKQDAQFAKVTVTASGTPSPSSEVIYLKKSSDGWIVIGDDSEDIEQLEIRFGLPDNF
jgi:histidinol phosphatase-like PHP family hydrolase